MKCYHSRVECKYCPFNRVCEIYAAYMGLEAELEEYLEEEG